MSKNGDNRITLTIRCPNCKKIIHFDNEIYKEDIEVKDERDAKIDDEHGSNY